MEHILRLAAIIGCALFGLTSGASAKTLMLTIDEPTCSVSDFTIGGFNATACGGAFSGNDSNSSLDGFFNVNGWTQIAKLEGPKSGSKTSGSLTVIGKGTSGTWSVSSWGGNVPIMAVIKGGPTFAAYFLNDLSAISGTWNTDGVLKGNNKRGPSLSHLTIYSGDFTPTPIPLPATVWLLLAGLGGLVVMKRRKAATV